MDKIKEKYCKGNPQRFEDFKLTERRFGTDLDALQRSIYDCKNQLEDTKQLSEIRAKIDQEILKERLFVRQTYFDFVTDKLAESEVKKTTQTKKGK